MIFTSLSKKTLNAIEGMQALSYITVILYGEVKRMFPFRFGKAHPSVGRAEQEASKLVRDGERQTTYGHPLADFTRTAKLWSVVMGTEVDPKQVALCLQLLKTSRLIGYPEHHDSIVDSIGYMICYQRIVEGEPDDPAV